MRAAFSALSLAMAALGGCTTVEIGGSTIGTASLIGSDGGPRGTASLMSRGTERVMQVELSGLTPGQHGLHIHGVGRCDLPDFKSAGPHWNPTDAQHGSLNPRGPHAGDLGNISVGADGRARTTVPLPLGADDLFDADGAAVMIHSGRDDLRTDPGGDSGDRVACGVLRPAVAAN